jgi:hypothetical protein
LGKKIQTSYIVLAVVGGFAALVAADHYILKGRLGIAGHINRLIGELKKAMGQGAGPIIPSDLPEGGLGPSTAQETPEQFEQEMALEEELAMQEPETASWARARMAARRARQARRRVRLGGYGI